MGTRAIGGILGLKGFVVLLGFLGVAKGLFCFVRVVGPTNEQADCEYWGY